jgi:calcineurin-like phosphoesterase family protein
MQEQSNKQFYISDWHYGHANVIAFDNRPFKSLLEMDEALVDRWNEWFLRAILCMFLGICSGVRHKMLSLFCVP